MNMCSAKPFGCNPENSCSVKFGNCTDGISLFSSLHKNNLPSVNLLKTRKPFLNEFSFPLSINETFGASGFESIAVMKIELGTISDLQFYSLVVHVKKSTYRNLAIVLLFHLLLKKEFEFQNNS